MLLLPSRFTNHLRNQTIRESTAHLALIMRRKKAHGLPRLASYKARCAIAFDGKTHASISTNYIAIDKAMLLSFFPLFR
jgi:hypothetical protein